MKISENPKCEIDGCKHDASASAFNGDITVFICDKHIHELKALASSVGVNVATHVRLATIGNPN